MMLWSWLPEARYCDDDVLILMMSSCNSGCEAIKGLSTI
jgi:hypothetical protein